MAAAGAGGRPRRRRGLPRASQGLHREGRRAGHGVGRPDDRAEGARQEADRHRLGRPAQRRRATASATAPRRPRRCSAGNSVPRRPGLRPGARDSALTQAIALKPDGIILGTIDASGAGAAARAGRRRRHQDRRLARRSDRAGRSRACRGVFTNITTDPLEVAKASGLYAVVKSSGHAGRHPVHRTRSTRSPRQDERREGGGRRLQGLQGARDRRHADRRPLQPHGPADHIAALEIRQPLDLLDRGQRSLFRLLRAVPPGRRRRSRRRLIRGRSRRATAPCRRSSASATSSTRSPPSPSR